MAAKVKEAPNAADVNPITDVLPEVANPADRSMKGKKSGKGGIGKYIALFVMLFFIGALVGIIAFNLFNIRSQYIQPALEKVPIVKNLFPANTGSGGEKALSYDELMKEYKDVSVKLEDAQKQLDDAEKRKQLDTDEITRLKEFENQQSAFRERQAEFDKLIALNDPAAYAKFYGSISPENQDALGEEATAIAAREKEAKKYVATVGAMDETKAAAILEEMISTDLNLVVMIINRLDNETSGAILGAMDPKNAASVMKRMAPVQE